MGGILRLGSVPEGGLRASFRMGRLGRMALGIALCVVLLVLSLEARGQLAMQRVAMRPTVSGIEKPLLWVVPAVLVASGTVLVNEFGLSGANVQRMERYSGWGQPQVRFDDALQHAPLLLGIFLDVSSDDVPRESLLERFSAKAMGGLAVAVVVLGVKNFRLAKRPDGEDRDSFMSGHTATAFLGAELLRLDYGAEYPWVAAAGYSVAMTTAMFRIWHARHWTGDVVAGAGVGIAAAWVGHYAGMLLADWVETRWYGSRAVPMWQY